MADIAYLQYHIDSSRIGDIDPANDCLTYISNRFELNMEQRYWLAFLYACTYCGPTAFYMYNEFPDYENVDVNRLQRWWDSNKSKCVFQTDRLRIKTQNLFVPTFNSYKELLGSRSQQDYFYQFKTSSMDINYTNAYREMIQIDNFGRFTMFIYLEMINLLTDYKCLPKDIDWEFAENCKKGICYAVGELENASYSLFDMHLTAIQNKLVKMNRCRHLNIFNIETTLCAYTKYKKGQRYIGYYIDRQKKEIEKMKANVTTGVCWRVLDEFRKETYKPHPNLTQPI